MNKQTFLGKFLGGRGTCRYCGVVVNNVSYHESNACKKRPNKRGLPKKEIRSCLKAVKKDTK